MIGICGGPSSGKTTIVDILKKRVKVPVTVLSQGDFYKPKRGDFRRKSRSGSMDEAKSPEMIKKEVKHLKEVTNFDVPSSIDFDLLVKGLDLLLQGKPFNRPEYDKEELIRVEATHKVFPRPLIIIEGHLIFNNEELLKRMSMKVYIDTDDDVRLSRRVLKEYKMHGSKMSLEDVLAKYEKFVKPSYEKYVEPTKKIADIVIPNYGFTTEDLDLKSMMVCIPAIDIIVKKIQSWIYGSRRL